MTESRVYADSYSRKFSDLSAFCGAQRQLVRWPTAAERR